MSSPITWWVISAAILIFAAGMVGRAVKNTALAIFVDNRGRMSLSHFQVVLWTIVVLSLLGGVFFGRLVSGVPDPLSFKIPDELLVVMGISIGSTTAATAIKASKDLASKDQAKDVHIKRVDTPQFSQLITAEEGSGPEGVIDITKFQNLWLTLIVIAAYVVAAFTMLSTKKPADLTSLPTFDNSLVTLLGISHVGYIGGKLPNKA